MKRIVKISLGITCTIIILIGVTGCRRDVSNLTPAKESNPPPISSVNEMNGSANIAKGGIAAVQDGWIYYTQHYDGDKNDLYGLYKMKTDGTNKVKLCGSVSSISNINVLGDWIYYCYEDIYRIKTDGTGKKKIQTGTEVRDVNVVGNQIYFTGYHVDWNEGSDVHSLCKVDINGNKMQVLRYDVASPGNVYIVNDWVYYYDPYGDEEENRDIYKMRTDGTETQVALKDKAYDFTVAGDWIYYLAVTRKGIICDLYKIKTDGTGCQKLAEGINIGFCTGLNVAGDWIYYLVETKNEDRYDLYRIKTDGTGCQKIAEAISIGIGLDEELNIAGDWIFYRTYNDRLYRIKTDGTNKEKIE